MENPKDAPASPCDDALAEGFVAGAIYARNQMKERLRHNLIESGDVVFHLDVLIALIEDAGAF